mgnify:CR=1 FL=1
MSDCLFCRIAAGEIPARIVHADEHVVAFHDVAPKAPTHVLVIPRRHLASLAAEVAQGAVRIQTGRVANYAFVMIAGLAVFVSLIAFGAAR